MKIAILVLFFLGFMAGVAACFGVPLASAFQALFWAVPAGIGASRALVEMVS